MFLSAAAAIIALAASGGGSCTQSVQTSSGGGSQSNSTTVVQTSQGGDGGSASCQSTVQSSNQASDGSVTRLSGSGARTTGRPLTEGLAGRWARRIARSIDAAAEGAAPDCRIHADGHVRCSVDWMAAARSAHLSIAFHATGDGIRWTYRGRIS